ncbi:MAG: hypothetical protein LBL04_00080 [Bacteroidales bacterium]|nr:hypothetical protein [Bacteroidales bacterium]
MKSKICQYFAAVLLGGLTLASCKDNDIVYNTDGAGKEFRTVSLAIPVGKVQVPLYATLRKETDDPILINRDGVMYVEYTHKEEVEWTDNIGINEVHNEFSCDVTGTYPEPIGPLPPIPTAPPGWSYPSTYEGARDTTIVLTTATTGGEDDETTYVERVTFAEGQFKFDIRLPSGFAGLFHLEMPQLTPAGASGYFSRDINTATASPDDYILDLAGATVNTILVDGKHVVVIPYSFKIGRSTPVSSTDARVTVGYDLSGVTVSRMFGYFGQQTPKDDGEGEIKLDFFDDFGLAGQFDFTGIEIDAQVKNRLGIPLQIDGKFDMYRDETKIDNALALNPPFNFKIAGATYNESSGTVAEAVTDFKPVATLHLDGNNLPNKMKFKVDGMSNPTPETDGERNFLVKGDDELVDVALNIRIPFHFKTSHYARLDTIEFDFNDLIKDSEAESEAVDEAILTLTIDNGLPLDINLGMVAVNVAGQRMSVPVISEQPIKSGVPGSGNQIASEHSVLNIRLTQEQIKEFRDRDVKNLVLETTAKTAGSDYVTLNDQSFLNIEISLSATVSLSFDLF